MAWHGMARHEAQGTRWRDLTPCLGLTNARMRPGANAHAAAASAALGRRVTRSRLSRRLSLPLFLHFSFSLCLMTLPEFGILNCNRFFNSCVRLAHKISLSLSPSLSLSGPLICGFYRPSRVDFSLECRHMLLLSYEPLKALPFFNCAAAEEQEYNEISHFFSQLSV